MRHRFGQKHVWLVHCVAAALLAAGVMPAGAYAAPASADQHASCSATGTYTIGGQSLPRKLPGSSQSHTSSKMLVYPVPYLGAVLRGTLVLTSYTGCGSPTSGTFAARLMLLGVRNPLPSAGKLSTTAAIVGPTGAPIVAGTTVLSTTGTIAQDPGHAGDPLFVLVRGTVAYGNITLPCFMPCDVPRAGSDIACPDNTMCAPPAAMVVARTATFSNITGYLLMNAARSTVSLTFLPPPDSRATAGTFMAAPVPVTLNATRGR